MYAGEEPKEGSMSHQAGHVLDRWVTSELSDTVRKVTQSLERYDVVTSGRAISGFVDDLSTWYVRRSRERFKNGTAEEKASALATLDRCLMAVAKLLAPFTPFVADALYRELGGTEESVHLDAWPEEGEVDAELNAAMKRVREACSLGLEKRAAAGLPVRQVLSRLEVRDDRSYEGWMLDIVAEEVNVKAAVYGKADTFEVTLATALTPQLKREGAARELTRAVNSLRREAKLTIQDRVTLLTETPAGFWKEVLDELGEAILRDVKADGRREGLDGALASGEVTADGATLGIGIVKN
jgi:isoleucyl-tRNA synthetase